MHTAVRYGVVFVTGLGSMLAGANVVHQFYEPDMTLKFPSPKITDKIEKTVNKQ
jgi:hypothetical protein